MDKIHPGV